MRGLRTSIVIQSYVTNQKGIIFSNLVHFCNQRLPLFVNPQHSRAQHVLKHNGVKSFRKEHIFVFKIYTRLSMRYVPLELRNTKVLAISSNSYPLYEINKVRKFPL